MYRMRYISRGRTVVRGESSGSVADGFVAARELDARLEAGSPSRGLHLRPAQAAFVPADAARPRTSPRISPLATRAVTTPRGLILDKPAAQQSQQ